MKRREGMREYMIEDRADMKFARFIWREYNMSDHTDDELISRALEIRDDIDAMKKHHGEELEPYESALQDIENALLARMVERQSKSIGTVHGTAYQSHQLRVKVADREVFLDYVIRNGAWNFITNHVVKEQVKEHMDTYGSNPPGIETTTFTQCNIRKA